MFQLVLLKGMRGFNVMIDWCILKLWLSSFSDLFCLLGWSCVPVFFCLHLTHVSLCRISYCTADKMHDKVFAYISQSQRNETLECHAFLCSKKKVVSVFGVCLCVCVYSSLKSAGVCSLEGSLHATPCFSFPFAHFAAFYSRRDWRGGGWMGLILSCEINILESVPHYCTFSAFCCSSVCSEVGERAICVKRKVIRCVLEFTVFS